MIEKVAGVYTVRGVMKGGRVEFLDDVDIEEGSLLDIAVVKTATQLRLEEKAAARSVRAPAHIRFGVGGKALSDDPLIAFRAVPKSRVAALRFDGYTCTASLPLDDIQVALADYALTVGAPPPDVKKAIRSALGKRKRMVFSPNTKAAAALENSLLQVLDVPIVDDENTLALWHMAAAAATRNNQYIAQLLAELPVYAAEMDVNHGNRVSTGGHGVANDRAKAIRTHEQALRKLLLVQVRSAVQRARRSLSGSSETEKLMKKEFKEIADKLG